MSESNIRCSYCGKPLRIGEPQIVVDFGETDENGIRYKDRVWEGHLKCFIKMLERGEVDGLLAALHEYLREYSVDDE